MSEAAHHGIPVRPCPFCATIKLIVDTRGTAVTVHCTGCGARGPSGRNSQLAIERWNWRHRPKVTHDKSGGCDCPITAAETASHADVSADTILLEIIGHLGAAISQTLPSDDQRIAEHVRAAHDLAKLLRKSAPTPLLRK